MERGGYPPSAIGFVVLQNICLNLDINGLM